MAARASTVFMAESFRSTREWLYFCVEFDLELCHACLSKGRKKRTGQTRSHWYCDDCHPAIHADLVRAIQTRTNVQTRCDLCGEALSIRDCWISEDCRRLYCSSHLKPLKKVDRFQLTRRYVKLRHRINARKRRSLPHHLRELETHERRVDCESCAFNGHGIYYQDRLVEIDRGEHRCDSEPDTLNCADLEA